MANGSPASIPAIDPSAQGAEAFRLMVESVIDYSIFMLDPMGNIVTWNEGARRTKGYEAKEVIGTHFSRFYPEEDRAAGKPERELKEAAEKGRVEDEGWRVRKDGTQFWANVVITALRTPEGKLWGYGKVTRDLTARKRAEEARRAAEVAGGRAWRLQALAAVLSRSASPKAVAEVVLRQGLDYLAAEGGLLYRLDPETSRLELLASVTPQTEASLLPVEIDSTKEAAIADVIRSGIPQIFRSRQELDRAYPGNLIGKGWPSLQSCVLLPLHDREESNGVLILRFAAGRDIGTEDMGFLLVLAEYASQALERSRIYEDLVVGRKRLATVLDQMPSGLAIVDAKSGKLLLSNSRNAAIFGAQAAPDGSFSFNGFSGVRVDGKRLEAGDWPVIRSLAGEVVTNEEIEIQRADGTHLTIRASSAPVRSEEGEVVAAVVTYDDISAELEARRAAARATERLRFLAEASRILGSSIEYETTLRNVAELSVPGFADWAAVDLVAGAGFNRVAVKHLDPQKIELAHELFRRVPPKLSNPQGMPEVIRSGKSQFMADLPEALIRQSVADPDLLRIYLALGLKSFVVVPMLVQDRAVGAITFVMAESGRHYGAQDLAIAEDLGRRAGVAIENSRLFRDSQEASRSKDEFLAVVSHELRTPLTAILGYASMLRKGDITGARREKALEVIERNARAQTQLIGDLLDISRIISGKLRLDVRSLPNLGAIVEAAMDSVRPAAEAREIRLHSVLDPRAGPVAGDSDRLQQVVWNLLINAIKFSPRQGRVQVQLARVNSHVELTVTDGGEGIEANFLPMIFDRFRQADSSFTRRHGGLGLGLSIVKNVVELHGGTVEAHSEGLGKGATFLVKLPLAPIHSTGPGSSRREHPTVSQSPSYDPGEVLKGITVLVVDDEEDSQEVVASILEQAKAVVIKASSAEKGLELVKAHRPDLIISDIGMPDEDGHAFIRRVRELPAAEGGQTPAVALTAYARVEDRTQALLAGFQMHVPKPVEPTELVVVASSLVRRRGS